MPGRDWHSDCVDVVVGICCFSRDSVHCVVYVTCICLCLSISYTLLLGWLAGWSHHCSYPFPVPVCMCACGTMCVCICARACARVCNIIIDCLLCLRIMLLNVLHNYNFFEHYLHMHISNLLWSGESKAFVRVCMRVYMHVYVYEEGERDLVVPSLLFIKLFRSLCHVSF